MPDRPTMTWEKSPQELIDLFTSLAPTAPGVEQKKMFGWPCCFVNGNLFTSLHKQSMISRLSEADQTAFLKLDGAAEAGPQGTGAMDQLGAPVCLGLAPKRKILAASRKSQTQE